MPDHIFYMQEALALARRGEGEVSPNPMVGAVCVKKGKIVSRGFHRKAGLPHAEINAIESAHVPLKGSTLYVNLEPCCHWGRTPPCVDRIISSGIKTVVIASLDPNPEMQGRSVSRLRRAGINVKVGVCREDALRLNEVFFKNMKQGRPFVVVKIAQSLDGKIATSAGQSRWITSEASRLSAKKMRDRYDAVAVGIGTVLKDNPRLEGFKKSPGKVVFDPFLRLPERAVLVRMRPEKLIVISSHSAPARKASRLKRLGVCVLSVECRNGRIDIKRCLKALYEKGITSLFVEGGSYTAGSFFDACLVDKIYFFIAPRIIGGIGALPSLGGHGCNILQKAPRIEQLSCVRIKNDFLFTGYPRFSVYRKFRKSTIRR